VIRQEKGQSVIVCGMLYQHWTLRPQTTSVSTASNRQRLETRTSQIKFGALLWQRTFFARHERGGD